MADIIREAPLGQVIRWITGNRVLKYPEEKPNFECPNCYRDPGSTAPSLTNGEKSAELDTSKTSAESDSGNAGARGPDALQLAEHTDLEKLHTLRTIATGRTNIVMEGTQPALTRTMTREMTRAYTRERFDIEQEEASMRERDLPIIAQRNEHGDILINWYTTDDPANPQNWSSGKKFYVGLLIL